MSSAPAARKMELYNNDRVDAIAARPRRSVFRRLDRATFLLTTFAHAVAGLSTLLPDSRCTTECGATGTAYDFGEGIRNRNENEPSHYEFGDASTTALPRLRAKECAECRPTAGVKSCRAPFAEVLPQLELGADGIVVNGAAGNRRTSSLCCRIRTCVEDPLLRGMAPGNESATGAGELQGGGGRNATGSSVASGDRFSEEDSADRDERPGSSSADVEEQVDTFFEWLTTRIYFWLLALIDLVLFPFRTTYFLFYETLFLEIIVNAILVNLINYTVANTYFWAFLAVYLFGSRFLQRLFGPEVVNVNALKRRIFAWKEQESKNAYYEYNLEKEDYGSLILPPDCIEWVYEEKLADFVKKEMDKRVAEKEAAEAERKREAERIAMLEEAAAVEAAAAAAAAEQEAEREKAEKAAVADTGAGSGTAAGEVKSTPSPDGRLRDYMNSDAAPEELSEPTPSTALDTDTLAAAASTTTTAAASPVPSRATSLDGSSEPPSREVARLGTVAAPSTPIRSQSQAQTDVETRSKKDDRTSSSSSNPKGGKKAHSGTTTNSNVFVDTTKQVVRDISLAARLGGRQASLRPKVLIPYAYTPKKTTQELEQERKEQELRNSFYKRLSNAQLQREEADAGEQEVNRRDEERTATLVQQGVEKNGRTSTASGSSASSDDRDEEMMSPLNQTADRKIFDDLDLLRSTEPHAVPPMLKSYSAMELSTYENSFFKQHIGSKIGSREQLAGMATAGTRSAAQKAKPKLLTPIICFVNPKSGGQEGYNLLRKFKTILHPVQVINLKEKITLYEPIDLLEWFVRTFGASRIKILVCGGDGTVDWVLDMLDRLDEHTDCFANEVSLPPVGIWPLGTGNDLARQFGWTTASGSMGGSGNLFGGLLRQADKNLSGATSSNAMRVFLTEFANARSVFLDRWQVTTYRNSRTRPTTSSMKTVGANLVKDFMRRSASPGKSMQPRGRKESVSSGSSGSQTANPESGVEMTSTSASNAAPATPTIATNNDRNSDSVAATGSPPSATAASPITPQSGSGSSASSMSPTTSTANAIQPGTAAASPSKTPDTASTQFEQVLQVNRTRVFSNYIGIGVDGTVIGNFHEFREELPGLFFYQKMNVYYYMMLGLMETILRSCYDLHKRVKITCDGNEYELEDGIEGIIISNITSYAGGSRLWQGPAYNTQKVLLDSSTKHVEDNLQKDALVNDNLLDVVLIRGAEHLALISIGLDRAIRLCQAREVEIEINSAKPIPLQIDGEPWSQPGISKLKISLKKNRPQAVMLKKIQHGLGERAFVKTLSKGTEQGIILPWQRDALLKEMSHLLHEYEEVEKGNAGVGGTASALLWNKGRRIVSTLFGGDLSDGGAGGFGRGSSSEGGGDGGRGD